MVSLVRSPGRCWRGLKGIVGDVAALASEIKTFVGDSCEACETGSRPWWQAIVALGGAALAAGAVSHWASGKEVASQLAGSYCITRVLSLRLLMFVYVFAFLVALRQNKGLIGDNGILPARRLLDRVEASTAASPRGRSFVRKFCARVERLPTLLWFAQNRQALNRWLDLLALTGLLLSVSSLILGGATCWQMLALWVIYHSINSVGQRWYSFGWESQLLETTLLTLLAAPLCSSWAFPVGAPTPVVAVFAFRWMAFRIMLGAGLIKLRGARCWKDQTAMCHHLETQPVPNPITRRFHNMPRQALLFSTACNHVIELLAPCLVLIPFRSTQVMFGTLYIIFQMTLIATGNLSFLNWLTMVPGIWFFDDSVLVGLLPSGFAEQTAQAALASATRSKIVDGALGDFITGTVYFRDAIAVWVIVWLSIPVYRNLLGPRGGARQRMNAAFNRQIVVPNWIVRCFDKSLQCFKGRKKPPLSEDPKVPEEPSTKRRRLESEDEDLEAPLQIDLQALRLLNSYGAFGSVNLERVEIVFEGCSDEGVWHPYTFKVAVDDPYKRPVWLAPYHYRLDWCRWIASCRGRRAVGRGLEEPWVLSFAAKLMLGNPDVRGLLAPNGDPFASSSPPRRIRAELYLYRFASPPKTSNDPYWLREWVGEYLSPVGLRELAPLLHHAGLLDYRLSR
eukprot:TRINITY_DN15460_c0_g1_i1.p1 TRINITY_DN15460_c0_g1~~TRINITY_DN15460_c0_g1_i1.p1  ORF type:complete len:678 (-),score=86.14 TRINITY_DN15460_c0_g1_i1:97-2130(-)